MGSEKMFQVAYRTGGTLNAKWHLTQAVRTKAEAQDMARSIERGGRKALVGTSEHWANIGLPDGYDS